MNEDQQSKALTYTLLFLKNEIAKIKEILKTSKDPLILEKILKDYESDYEVFQEIENELI